MAWVRTQGSIRTGRIKGRNLWSWIKTRLISTNFIQVGTNPISLNRFQPLSGREGSEAFSIGRGLLRTVLADLDLAEEEKEANGEGHAEITRVEQELASISPPLRFFWWREPVRWTVPPSPAELLHQKPVRWMTVCGNYDDNEEGRKIASRPSTHFAHPGGSIAS